MKEEWKKPPNTTERIKNGGGGREADLEDGQKGPHECVVIGPGAFTVAALAPAQLVDLRNGAAGAALRMRAKSATKQEHSKETDKVERKRRKKKMKNEEKEWHKNGIKMGKE
jgi:hypothetical protein